MLFPSNLQIPSLIFEMRGSVSPVQSRGDNQLGCLICFGNSVVSPKSPLYSTLSLLHCTKCKTFSLNTFSVFLLQLILLLVPQYFQWFSFRQLILFLVQKFYFVDLDYGFYFHIFTPPNHASQSLS